MHVLGIPSPVASAVVRCSRESYKQRKRTIYLPPSAVAGGEVGGAGREAGRGEGRGQHTVTPPGFLTLLQHAHRLPIF